MAHVAQSFLIYINDLPQHIRTWPNNIFAGDNAIYTTGKSFMETKCALQSSVYDAERWFDNSNLQINIKKTICMLIAIESGCPRRAHVVSGIERHNSWTVLDHPYLGLQLDDKMQWEAHVQRLCWNISSKLAVLSRLRQVLNKKLLCKQYIACIQPFIDHAVSVWASCSEQSKGLAT